MSSERTAPDFQVFDAGQPITKTVRAAVIQITVDERLNQAAACTIELRDDGGMLSDGTKFKLGSELRVALGYMGATKVIFEGEVTGWKGAFPRRGPRTLTVVAHDRFHRLRREKKQRTFLSMKDSEIAQKIASEYGFSCDVKTSLVKHDYIIQANEPDADFLLERARASGYELFMDAKKLVFRAPKVDGAAAVKLKWHENLKRFAPTISVARTPTQVTATSYDMKQKKLVTVSAKKGDEGAAMGGSKTAADLAGVIGDMTHHIPWMPLMAPEEMQSLAKGLFALSALRLVTGEGEAQGDTAIRRGSLVDVDAIGDFLSGSYYVDAALHTLLPGHGYTTTFRVKRLAVAKPPAPPPAKAPAAGPKGPAPEHGPGKVEFVVTNQFGDPIEGLEYILTCPDGEKKTGKIPASGVVSEPNAKPGIYKLAIKGVDPPKVVQEEGEAPKKAAAANIAKKTPTQGLKVGEPATFTVKLVDGQGKPLENVDVEFDLDGQKMLTTTDKEGIARIDAPQPKNPVKARLAEMDKLRDQVRPKLGDLHGEPEPMREADAVIELGGGEAESAALAAGAGAAAGAAAAAATKDDAGTEKAAGDAAAGDKSAAADEPETYRIQLHDNVAYEPIASTPVEITLPSGVVKQTTDAQGYVEVKVPAGTDKISVSYTPQGADAKVTRDIYFTSAAPDSDEALLTHLKNMGFYRKTGTEQHAILRFQGAHPDLEVTGELDDKTKAAIKDIVEGGSMKDKL